MDDDVRSLSATEAREYLQILDREIEMLMCQRRDLAEAKRLDLAYDRKLEIHTLERTGVVRGTDEAAGLMETREFPMIERARTLTEEEALQFLRYLEREIEEETDRREWLNRTNRGELADQVEAEVVALTRVHRAFESLLLRTPDGQQDLFGSGLPKQTGDMRQDQLASETEKASG